MNLFRGRRSDLAASFAAAVVLALPLASAAQGVPQLWFQGTRLIFEHAVPTAGDLAVSTRDPGLRRFLDRLGAVVSYAPQQRYVVVTAEDRRTIVFTLGDPSYTIGGVRARAPFSPAAEGDDVTLPFLALARALYVEPVAEGNETVLQPRIGALDVRTEGTRTTVTVRAAMPLIAETNAESPERLQVSFVGQGSSLSSSRGGAGPAVDAIDVAVRGTTRVPTTTVTIAGARGTTHRIVPSGSPDTYVVVFERAGTAVAGGPPTPPPLGGSGGAAPVTPAQPASSPNAAPGPVVAGRSTVTNVVVAPASGNALGVRLTLSGATGYTWHRLLDRRWYLDLAQTTLNGPGREERPSVGDVESVRVRQIGTSDAPVVRVALTLADDETAVAVSPSDGGITITAGGTTVAQAARTGAGRTDGAPVPPSAVVSSTPPADPAWKYAPNANSKLIVLDPGHGGGDIGTAHNGLVEKDLTLDIAQRLRTLLVAQGWQVRMTRDGDVDPISPENLARMRGDGKPNADDRAYLQTRCDVANNANARLFISIHINSAPSTSARGTTVYWYKPQDAALAQAIERSIIPLAGTQDDGTRHENFYVVRHTTMPAVLIETAFITNPDDVALLRQPSFLQNVAQGIANGVKAYTGMPRAGTVSAQ